MQGVWRSWIAGVLLLAAAAAGHAACAPKYEITFADGVKGCLTDHAFSNERASGSLGALSGQVPVHGGYALALPRRPAMCPAARGMWVALSLGSSMPAPNAQTMASSTAVADCQRAAGPAAPGSACECVEVTSLGSSRLARAEFERMATEAAAPASITLDPTWAAQAAAVVASAAHAAGSDAPVITPGITGCLPKHLLRFADGSRACLTEFALADRRPVGHMSAVRVMVPGSGAYHVALPEAGGTCQPAVGFTYTQFLSIQAMAAGQSTAERAAQAVAECQRAGRADRLDDTCRCKLVIEEGQSALTLRQFSGLAGAPATETVASGSLLDRLVAAVVEPKPSNPAPTTARPGSALSAPAAVQTVRVPPTLPTVVQSATLTQAAPATAAPTLAITAPVVAAPVPAMVAAATGPSATEMAAMRQQIEALQAQMARQAAAVAPVQAAKPAPARMRTRALVVGNGAYASLGALPNPRRDAEAIAAKLRGYGIEVDLVVDADRNALVKALNDYQSRAAGYDVNILFYAGHGLQISGNNYIVPVDMAGAGASVGSVKLTAVALNDALEYLPARTRVVFLDACRDNPLSRSLMATRSAASLGLAPVNTSSGTLVAYATKDGSVAEDGSGRNSPYTTALLQHLDADEDIAVVLRRVRQAVLQATSSRQEPWEYGSLVGDQLIVSKMSRP